MSAIKRRFRTYTLAVALVTLVAGWGLASAAEDQFTADLGRHGKLVTGGGTGFNKGAWYYYPPTGQLVQWFYNGDPDPNSKKIVEVELTAERLDLSAGKVGVIEASVNWTRATWPQDEPAPPLPDPNNPGLALQFIQETVFIPRTSVLKPMTVKATVEIPDLCPQWISIDIRGENVRVEGRVGHECVPKVIQMPPMEDRDFGDAPEGVVAYPAQRIRGAFPTCVEVGPAAWIEHAGTGKIYFGRKVDRERDGNAGDCPVFTPDAYNGDEGMNDSDAGLITPRAYTIRGPVGYEDVYSLIFTGLQSMSNACYTAIWGMDIDIQVHNNTWDEAYVNLLMDWNHDGQWGQAAPCRKSLVPEHALVNFPVPAGYHGPLSELAPPNFRMGPLPGYIWARFTISERPVRLGWTGDGVFDDGETEDYLLHVKDRPPVCSWSWYDRYKMHWPQLPDKKSTGIDVDLYGCTLADDFQCTQSGEIAGIHFWGSFKDDVTPVLGVDSLTFEVNIYADQPADSIIPWNRPGALLWTGQIGRFSYDVTEVSHDAEEGWYEPVGDVYLPDNHMRVYQYDICLDPNDELFFQTQDEIYWLEVKEIRGSDNSYFFGWKTTKEDLRFNAPAVWRGSMPGWLPLAYPTGHAYDGERLDLAFVITRAPWGFAD